MRFLGSSKFLKTRVELLFTTQKANAFSPWTVALFSTGNTLFG